MKHTITDISQELIKSTLTTDDYKEIAKAQGYSYSTVYNIVSGQQQINDQNKHVFWALIQAVDDKINELQALRMNVSELNINELQVGDKITYLGNSELLAGWDNGRIKEIPEQAKGCGPFSNMVIVVYGEYEDLKSYAGQKGVLVHLRCLRAGWKLNNNNN